MLSSYLINIWEEMYRKGLIFLDFIILDLKCSSQSKIGQQCFLRLWVELIFHKVFPKTNMFSSFVNKSLRNFFWRTILNFCRFLELVHLLIHTNIWSMQLKNFKLKILQSKLFLNICSREKSQIVSLSTLDQHE